MPTSAKKTKEPMHYIDILGELKKRGHSWRSVARELDVDASSVSNVARGGLCKSHRIATRIAELIEKPINDIWPDVYNYEPRESFKERVENARRVA